MSATINTAILVQKVIDAFKTSLPPLNAMSLDLSGPAVKFGDNVKARIRKVPTVRNYDANTGYRANAANALDLLEDVDVTINRHRHAPVFFKHEDLHRADINLEAAAADAGFALAKDVVDYALSLASSTNFSTTVPVAASDTDFDTIESIRSLGNTRLMGGPRYGIVSTGVAGSLSADARINNRDFYSSQNDQTQHLRRFTNIAGFKEVWEYPDIPGNSEEIVGVFFDPRAFAVAIRPVVNPSDLAAALGVPSIANFVPITDDETGLTMTAISYMEPGTLNLVTTVAMMYGISAGSRGGSANDVTDRAGILLSTDTSS
jgi:hypothetical protein